MIIIIIIQNKYPCKCWVVFGSRQARRPRWPGEPNVITLCPLFFGSKPASGFLTQIMMFISLVCRRHLPTAVLFPAMSLNDTKNQIVDNSGWAINKVRIRNSHYTGRIAHPPPKKKKSPNYDDQNGGTRKKKHLLLV